MYITTTKVDIIGDEINIRHFFHDFFYQSDITSHTVIPSIEAQEIAMSLRKEHFFQEYSKISFFDFNYIIFITLERFIKGNNIIVFSKDKLFLKNQLLKHMKLINLSHVKEMIKIFYNVELTDEERTYMYILLISRRSIESLEAEENFIKHFSYWPETIYLAEELIHRFEIRGERKKRTIIFFNSFFTSLFLKYTVSPILVKNFDSFPYHIKKIHPNIYDICHEFISEELTNFLHLNHEQVDSISADMTLFIDSVNNKNSLSKKNILLLLEGNQFIVNSIQTRIYKYFYNHHNLNFPDITELNSSYFDTHQFDIVVTNYFEYLEQFDIKSPTIILEPVPTTSNWKELFRILAPDLGKDLSLIDF